MFQPSPSILFRPMPVLNRLSIHRPLPLSHNESIELLNLFKSSFRQQLDKEHPPFRTEVPPAPTRRQRPSQPEQESHATSRHMHALLTNQLFRSPGTDECEVGGEPMDVFDQAVAKGMMTTTYAKACLQAKKSQINRSSISNIRDGMKKSGAGLKVLKWLLASGTTNNIEFLDDAAFAKILMEYMVAEDLQEAAWKWIKISLERHPALAFLSGPELAQARLKVVGPLVLLVRAEAENKLKSLDSAYIALSRAAGYLHGLSTPEMTNVLGVPGWFLFKTSIQSRGTRPAPGDACFESFLSLVPVTTLRPGRQIAYLNLIHPTRPSPEKALEYFESVSMNSPIGLVNKSKAHLEVRNISIQLGLDTASVLLELHRYSEARWVLEVLRTAFPQQLGIEEMKQLKQAKAEASSLELLEGLCLA